MDEHTLERIDADPEARAEGRSAFIRRAVARYLAEKREQEIADLYSRAYAEHPVTPDEMLVPTEPIWAKE